MMMQGNDAGVLVPATLSEDEKRGFITGLNAARDRVLWKMAESVGTSGPATINFLTEYLMRDIKLAEAIPTHPPAAPAPLQPTPWRRGEEHESMCEIVDAEGREVCRIQALRADRLAALVVTVVNMAAGVWNGE